MPANFNRNPNPQRTRNPLACLLCLMLVGLLATAGCEEAATETNAPDPGLTAQENDIKAAVEAMQARGDNARVTITDADAQRLLMLELEQGKVAATVILEWLDEAQIPAARGVFRDAGATAADLNVSSEMYPEFTVTLPGDAEHVARFAAKVLEEIYALAPQEALVFETEEDE